MGIREALDELKARRQSALELGGAMAVGAQHALDRLTARERLELLLDRDSFLELGMLARCQDPGLAEGTAADGLITGFGDIAGTTVAVLAEDATVLDNTDGEVAATKRLRLLSLAEQMGWPLVFLCDRGQGQVKEVREAQLFGRAAPQRPEPDLGGFAGVKVALVMGNCFGQTASLAAQADLLVLVKGAALSLLGPALGRGEESADWRTHAEVTGLVDCVADDDRAALALARDFLGYVPANALLEPARVDTGDSPERAVPELLDVVPDDLDAPYDMATLIARLVDPGQFLTLKPGYGRGVITCLARLDGHAVGIVASQPLHQRGALDADAMSKVQRLVERCDRFHLPLVFLQDTPGYLAQSEQERRDILTRATRLVTAIKNARVPRVALIPRRGFVLGEFPLGARKLGLDYIAAWPLAEVGTREPVIYAEPPGKAPIAGVGPWYAAGLAFLDDIIEPQDTRRVLVRALEVARRSPSVPPPEHTEMVRR